MLGRCLEAVAPSSAARVATASPVLEEARGGEPLVDHVEVAARSEQSAESLVGVVGVYLRQQEVDDGHVEDLAEQYQVVGIEASASAARVAARFHLRDGRIGQAASHELGQPVGDL